MYSLLAQDSYFRKSIFLRGRRPTPTFLTCAHEQSAVNTVFNNKKIDGIASVANRKEGDRSNQDQIENLKKTKSYIEDMLQKFRNQSKEKVEQYSKTVDQLNQKIQSKDQQIWNLQSKNQLKYDQRVPQVFSPQKLTYSEPNRQIQTSLQHRLIILTQDNAQLRAELQFKSFQIERLLTLIENKAMPPQKYEQLIIEDSWEPQRKKYEDFVRQLEKHHSDEIDHYIEIVTKQQAKILQLQLAISTNAQYLNLQPLKNQPINSLSDVEALQTRHNAELDLLHTRLSVAESQLQFLRKKYTHLMDLEIAKNISSRTQLRQNSPKKGRSPRKSQFQNI